MFIFLSMYPPEADVFVPSTFECRLLLLYLFTFWTRIIAWLRFVMFYYYYCCFFFIYHVCLVKF